MSSESSYYVPASSKLPIFMAISLLLFVYGAGYTINDLGKEDTYSHWILISSFLLMWGTMFFWFSEVIKENDAGMYSNNSTHLLCMVCLGLFSLKSCFSLLFS